MQVIRKGFILDNRKFYKHIHLVRILIHLRVVSRIWLTEK